MEGEGGRELTERGKVRTLSMFCELIEGMRKVVDTSI